MLLKKANTITTPTAYSDGFLHSVKPEVVENLLTYSNDFSNAAWSGAGVSKTGGQSGYDGSSDAWLLTSSINYTSINLNVSSSGVHTFSAYLKDNNIGLMQLYVLGSSFGLINIDLTAGVITGQAGTTVIDKGIESVGNGWYRAYIVVNDSITRVRIIFNDLAGTSFYIQDAQLNKGLTAYPYLETTTEAKPSADFTFTRNSSATRVNELGYIEDVQIIGGELVSNGDFEEVGSELVTNGGFDTDSDWSKSNSTISDGKGNLDSTSGTSLLFQSALVVGKTYRATLDVTNYNGLGTCALINSNGETQFEITSNGSKEFNFTQGGSSSNLTFRAVSGGIFSIDNVSVKEVGQDWSFGTGWSMGDGYAFTDGTINQSLSYLNVTTIGRKYRISFDVTRLSSGTIDGRFWFGSVNPVYNFNNEGNYSFDLIANDTYFRITALSGNTASWSVDNISVKEVTDDTNLPRINYEGFTYENGLPVPYSGKGHLLLEGQSTNLVTYSEDASTYTYVESSNSASSEITPDETQSASLFQTNTSNSTHYFGLNSYSFTSGVTITSSLFVKKGTGRYFQLVNTSPIFGTDSYASYDLENGLVTSVGSAAEASIVDYGNGWYRCILTGTPLSSNVGVSIFFGVSITSANAARSEAHTQELNYHIWGGQCEVGSYSTSYIPTNGSAVTRLAETCNNATQSFPSEGVLYAEIAALVQSGSDRAISIYYDSSNTISLFYFGTTNTIRALIFNSGATQASIDFLADDVLDFNKVAIRYKDNDISLWANGSLIGTDTSCTIPTNLASLDFRYAGSNFYGKTKMVATFPYLSNDEMECLTGEGYGTFEALAAAYSYTIK